MLFQLYVLRSKQDIRATRFKMNGYPLRFSQIHEFVVQTGTGYGINCLTVLAVGLELNSALSVMHQTTGHGEAYRLYLGLEASSGQGEESSVAQGKVNGATTVCSLSSTVWPALVDDGLKAALLQEYGRKTTYGACAKKMNRGYLHFGQN